MRTLSLSNTWAAKTHTVPSGRWVRTGFILADVVFVWLNAAIVYSFRYGPEWLAGLLWLDGSSADMPAFHVQKTYVAFLLVYVTLILFAIESQDLYRVGQARTRLDESLAVTKAVGLATLLLTVFIYLSGVKSMSRLVVVSCGLLNIATLAAWRIWRRDVIERRVASNNGGRNVLIVGAGEVGQDLANYLTARKELGFVFKGFLDGNLSGDPRVLGHAKDLSRVARAQFADEVFITIPVEQEVVRSVAMEARRNRLDVKLIPEPYAGFGLHGPLEYVGDFPVIELHRQPIPTLGLFAKRLVDLCVAALGLALLSPLFAVIAVAIKLDSPGPVFYRAIRIGKKGRRFVCLKFRSMVADADAKKNQLRHLNERSGPIFKISNDPRLTRAGTILRKFSLDEFPQLWNVLKGDMSLVGPRPHPTDDFEQYQLEHLRRLEVTPGITGLWQVTARRDPSFEKSMRLDLEYIENWNLWLDIKILLKTIPAVFTGSGD
ncbi:MAG: sugar transferase [Acidobacteria bacterium]|nr:sugar transferase [Acidobacteriota bacterium]